MATQFDTVRKAYAQLALQPIERPGPVVYAHLLLFLHEIEDLVRTRIRDLHKRLSIGDTLDYLEPIARNGLNVSVIETIFDPESHPPQLQPAVSAARAKVRDLATKPALQRFNQLLRSGRLTIASRICSMINTLAATLAATPVVQHVDIVADAMIEWTALTAGLRSQPRFGIEAFLGDPAPLARGALLTEAIRCCPAIDVRTLGDLFADATIRAALTIRNTSCVAFTIEQRCHLLVVAKQTVDGGDLTYRFDIDRLFRQVRRFERRYRRLVAQM